MKRIRISGSSIIIVTIMVVAFLIVLFFLTYKKEKYTSIDQKKDIKQALVCVSGDREDTIFNSSTAKLEQHELKIVFGENNPSNMFYSFKGKYDLHDEVVRDENIFHTNYNVYMGENNLSLESLSPTYSILEKEFIMNLYIDDFHKIKDLTSVFFFINKDDISNFSNFSIDQAESYYEEKDFTCKKTD